MLSEELSFVDLSPAVDMYDSRRHDHLCQGSTFLDVTKRLPLEGNTSATTNDEDVDPCAAVLQGWHRAWCKLMGQWTSRNGKIVYTRRNWVSNISLKTFRSRKSGVDIVRRLGLANDNKITCTTSIAMFRVVSTLYGRHAEYEVNVTCGGRRWISWERFTNFKSLASICAAAGNGSNEAWGDVVMAKPAGRCLNRRYLAFKCRLLETFLRQAMFAMASPALLIQFVTRNRNP